jgi:CRP-like cAMP-binding protein
MSAFQSIFAHQRDVERFASGAPIFRRGEVGEKMYAVLDGEVDVLVDGQVVDTVGPGGLVGEMALIERAPRSADAVARTDCRVAAVDERRFAFLVQQTPFFALEVMRVLADRLRRTTTKVHPR